jgi:hypothetical protein
MEDLTLKKIINKGKNIQFIINKIIFMIFFLIIWDFLHKNSLYISIIIS